MSQKVSQDFDKKINTEEVILRDFEANQCIDTYPQKYALFIHKYYDGESG